ncbi:MAG: hypothetical protein M1292_05550 [Bacteroidetes bacterium]|nr:hypothetical protein [Bacteroidota bacterium]
MKINSDNYEIWFLDYLEGRLDQQGQEEVRLFLKQNPGLASGLEAFMPVLSMDAKLLYPDKGRLKKEKYDDPAYFETTAIAAMEGDLAEEERVLFMKWLAKKPGQQEFVRRLNSCKLHPDYRISFPGRDKLKKKSFVLNNWIRVAAVAAILLFAFFLFYPEKKSEAPAPVFSAETIRPQQVKPPLKVASATNPSNSKPGKTNPRQKSIVVPSHLIVSKHKIPDTVSGENRRSVSLEMLQPRLCTIRSTEPDQADLALTKVSSLLYAASGEIQLSDFLESKLQALKAEDPKEFITRKEVTLAGLRLFSKVPGHRLTGKKGADGRLKSISFNSQLLAISIPVNR